MKTRVLRYQRLHRAAKAIVVALCAAAWVPGCAPGGERAGAGAWFACADGKSIAAEFGRESVFLSLSDGRRMELPRTVSGSGARYADADESVVFWNKGDGAFLQERGRTTYDGCRTRPN
jgi:membrane-bound inhibitor of C-type lysozyme